jgi:riboflavin biosynthesis pyrimidine reductase
MVCASRANVTRFETYCERKKNLALAAPLYGFRTIEDATAGYGLVAIGNDWTRRLFDGDFYQSPDRNGERPIISLVFVQSRDGNTGADNPSTLGGGATDKHLIYEGLSRVDADAVLAGATTARGDRIVFSVWHPELVDLRRSLGRARHPAQIVVTDRGDLPIERALMYEEPDVPVFVITRSAVALGLRERVRDRPWVDIVDAGDPVSLAAAMRYLRGRGIRIISAIGGRRTATALLREGLVNDLYLTTSPIEAGEPNTPFYEGPPLSLSRVLLKAGQGTGEGVRFEHFVVDSHEGHEDDLATKNTQVTMG